MFLFVLKGNNIHQFWPISYQDQILFIGPLSYLPSRLTQEVIVVNTSDRASVPLLHFSCHGLLHKAEQTQLAWHPVNNKLKLNKPKRVMISLSASSLKMWVQFKTSMLKVCYLLTLAHCFSRSIGHQQYLSILPCPGLSFQVVSMCVQSSLCPFQAHAARCSAAGMMQWWEGSPPTNVARVRIPDPASYVGWVCCWFSVSHNCSDC